MIFPGSKVVVWYDPRNEVLKWVDPKYVTDPYPCDACALSLPPWHAPRMRCSRAWSAIEWK